MGRVPEVHVPRRAGMAEKAAEFKALGSEIYLSEDGTVREAID